MGELIELAKFRKAKVAPAQVIGAQMLTEEIRSTLFAMPSTEARMELCFMLLAQISNWIIKSGHYDNPGDRIKVWLARKIEHYTKQQKEG